MESLDVFTQKELDDALARPDVIPVCSGDGSFEVGGEHFVRAADWARVTLRDSASAEAGGWAAVVASGSTAVVARDSVQVSLSDAARARVIDRVQATARDRARITAAGDSLVDAGGEAFVTATSLAIVAAGDRCSVRALSNSRAHLSGEARAWAWGTAVVRALDSASVSAWGSASVFATGTGSVEAREQAMVVAGGSTAVRAFGMAMVRARAKARVEAAATVAVTRHGAGMSVATTGVIDAVLRFQTPEEWCAYYGVDVRDGVATLYKAVEDDFTTWHGGSYQPGTEPVAHDWDGGEQECGGGLHLSPLPTLALPHPDDVMRFVACPVRLTDIAVHPNGIYRDKVKARAVCAPVYEVNEDRTPAQDKG
jgi:hypothetical protein